MNLFFKHIFMLGYAVLRDIKERGRNLEQVLSQYMNVVKPAFEEFTLPVSNPYLFVPIFC